MTTMVWRSAAALIVFSLAACSSSSRDRAAGPVDPGGPGNPFFPLGPVAPAAPGGAVPGGGGDDPPPNAISRVAIVPALVDIVRPGLTVPLTATAYNARGDVLPAVRFTWRTDRPAALAVTPTGVATAVPLSGFGQGPVRVIATAGGKEGVSTFNFDAWSVETNATVVNAETAVTTFSRGPLAFQCTGGVLRASFRPRGLVGGEQVEYRLDGGAARVEQWRVESGTLIYRGDARLLARDVAAAKTLTFQYAEFGVGPAAVTVDFLEGLAPYLPRLVELCP